MSWRTGLTALGKWLVIGWLAAAAAFANGEGTLRKWTDVTGRVIEATLVEHGEQSVTLEKASNGKTYVVPLDKLSQEDRQWLAEQRVPAAADFAPESPSANNPAAPLRDLGGEFNGGADVVAQLTSRLNVKWPWFIGIALANIPLYVMWFGIFFGNFAGFMESVGYALQPDSWSWWKGEGMEDSWHELKLFVFVIWVPLTVIAQYALVHKQFLS